MGSLDQVNGQVEALNQFGVLDAGDEQLGHLHLQEVGWQALDLVVIDLQLDSEKRGCLVADLEHCW